MWISARGAGRLQMTKANRPLVTVAAMLDLGGDLDVDGGLSQKRVDGEVEAVGRRVGEVRRSVMESFGSG